ncbi:MAG: hypothetical protein WCK92_06520 [Bacteroidota bacterium]
MRNYPLLLLAFICIVLITASCKMKPRPPEAMKLPGNGDSIKAYIKAENEYSEKWLDHYDVLKNAISAELAGRRQSTEAPQSRANDSIFESPDWKILVMNRNEVRLQPTGKNKQAGRVIYTEPDRAFRVSLRTSASLNFIFIESISESSSEARLIPASLKSLKPLLLQERKKGVFYRADHFGGNNIWILSNENAPRRCLIIAPVSSPGSEGWKAAVKENDSVFIDSYEVIDEKFLAIVQRKHLGTSIEITSLYQEVKGPVIENKINFPEPEGQISDFSYSEKDDKLVFTYSSIITPPTCYTYGIHSMHMGIRWKKQIKLYDQDNYKASVITAVGNKGERVPVSLISKRDEEPLTRPKPLLLLIMPGEPWEYGKGFSPYLISLLDRGVALACVHVPLNNPSGEEGSQIINAAASALIGKQITSAGLITLVARDPAAIPVVRSACDHPEWFRALTLESPRAANISCLRDIPFVCIYTDQNQLTGTERQPATVSEMRKLTKEGNTLLLISGDRRVKEENMMAGLLTFILAANGINK